MSKDADSVDLTFGNYRRLYTGIQTSIKLSGVSLEALCWYTHLLLVVDDFGNTKANPKYLAAVVYPMRDVSSQQVNGWNTELINARAAMTYEVKGEPFLHLFGFKERQTTRNGKPVRRHPPAPCESDGVNPDESRKSKPIQMNPVYPDESSASNSRAIPESKSGATANQPLDSLLPAQGFSSAGDALLALLRVGFAREMADTLINDCGLPRISWAVGRFIEANRKARKSNPAGWIRRTLQSPDGPAPPAPVLAKLDLTNKRQATLKALRTLKGPE